MLSVFTSEPYNVTIRKLGNYLFLIDIHSTPVESGGENTGQIGLYKAFRLPVLLYSLSLAMAETCKSLNLTIVPVISTILRFV